MLTNWITKPTGISIFNIVAIGGMGKSALTWHWFNNIAPQEKKWEGRIWWSFYETDATFDNFIIKALTYISGRAEKEIKKLTTSERQDNLFQILDSSPYLIVLDGLERILVAYARPDAAFLDDDTALDEDTSNWIAGAMGLPKSSAKSFTGKHRLRKTTDTRVGHFLRKLSQIRKSKILVSTRLYPTDLQTHFGRPYPRCYALFLSGLSDQDALELWRTYGAKGSRDQMLPVFRSFNKHPLLLQLLASEVAEFRGRPGDFDAWKKANPDFNVFGLPLIQVQSHVLSFALKGLTPAELRTLQVIAAFRMPSSMATLKALLLKKEDNSIYSSEAELDKSLTILEDKGLLGWDRNSNRYDLHPIVRGVVWKNLDPDKQYEIHGSLKSHFEAMPMIEDYTEVQTIEDLRPAIELYNSLIEMKLFDQAFRVLYEKLDDAILYRLSVNNLRRVLLEQLFVDGVDQLPSLSSKTNQGWVMDALGHGYRFSGSLSKAISLYNRGEEIAILHNNDHNAAISLSNSSTSFRLSGQLFKAEFYARKGLKIAINHKDDFLKSIIMTVLGEALSSRGGYNEAKKVFVLKIRLSNEQKLKQNEGTGTAFLAQTLLYNNENKLAKELADEAWKLASFNRFERDFIRAASYQGIAALRLNDVNTANERLHFALKLSQSIQSIEDELQVLVALAEFHLKNKDLKKAREYLYDIWNYAKEGPYPLFHADALNILAQIEIQEGSKEKAIKAATEAYQRAWCDGPPYAYHYGLEKAKSLLKELGAQEPKMPAFDPSKFEPMPEVEIDPDGLLEEE